MEKMRKHLPDIPSGPQGGMVYNPDPYVSVLCPYRLKDLCRYLEETGRTWEEMTEEERERFRAPEK